MNTKRLAELFARRAELNAQLGEVDRELAEAMTDLAANDQETKPRPKRIKKPRRYVIPDRPVTELDKHRAKSALRRAGLVGSTE